jgi:hypothetical protein
MGFGISQLQKGTVPRPGIDKMFRGCINTNEWVFDTITSGIQGITPSSKYFINKGFPTSKFVKPKKEYHNNQV